MFPVGNNLNRGHIYFQDFWKRFSILFKAQQLQLNRKQKLNKKKRRKEPTWALPVLAQPPGSAQPAGATSRRPPRVRRTRGACSPCAGHAPATSCFCRRRETPRGRHATPTSPSHPLAFSPSSPSSSPAMAERVPRRRSP